MRRAFLLATAVVAAGCGGTTTIDPVASGGGPVADDHAKVVTLAENANARAVAIDGDLAYFTTDSAVLVAPLAGGAPRVVAGSVHPVAGSRAGLAIDGTTVFWPEHGASDRAILATPKSGGAPRDAAPALTGSPLAVVVDATDVYFSTDDGAIAKVAKTGGAITVLATDQPSVIALTVDDEGVYWATEGSTTSPGLVRKVYKAQQAGVITLAQATGAVEGIAVDATCLYFTDLGDGSIKMVWKDGSHPTAMATNQLAPRAVVKDESTNSIFWLTGSLPSGPLPVGGHARTDGAVMSLTAEEGAPIRVVHALVAPEALAVGPRAVVWSGGGSVYAVLR